RSCRVAGKAQVWCEGHKRPHPWSRRTPRPARWPTRCRSGGGPADLDRRPQHSGLAMNERDGGRTGGDGARRVTILGSTGSVGQNTVDLLLRNRDGFVVEALTANRNPLRLAEQARALRARFAVIGDPMHYPGLEGALAGSGIEAASGAGALVEAAQRPADWVMAGIVGAAGLAPTLAAIRRGVIVALANKEVLVCAGALVMQEVSRCGATLLPVDSEH